MKMVSANEKGKRFEKAVAKLVEDMGFGLARREAGSGNGLRKGDIAWNLLKTAELKNTPSKFPKYLLDCIEQAERQDIGHYGWVLIMRDPRVSEANLRAFAVLDMHQYLELEKEAMVPRTENPDRDFKYKVERLKRLAHDCMKLAEERSAEWKFKDLKMAAGEVIKSIKE